MKINKVNAEPKYKTELDIPVGGVFENVYGAICWKTKYSDEYGTNDVIIVLKPGCPDKNGKLNPDVAAVFYPSMDCPVKEYLGLIDQFVEINVTV